MLDAKEQGEPYDDKAHPARLRGAVGEIVRKQIELGIDVIDDGEFGKPSFVTYVNERLGGFEVDKPRCRGSHPRRLASREARSFPDSMPRRDAGRPRAARALVCTGPISYVGQAQLQRDIDNLKAALDGAKAAEAFMPAISPTNASDWQRNAYYKTDEEYLFAIADALREEYKAIVDAGFLLQIDDPRLVTYYKRARPHVADCRKWAEVRVEALNHALRGIPPRKIRFHTCYGINMGPRIHDLELKDIVDMILKIKRRRLLVRGRQPAPRARMEGVGDRQAAGGQAPDPGRDHHSTILVEHPELVAERIGALRQGGGARERHRRRRLRLRDLRRVEGGPPEHRLGEIQVARRWRQDRQQAAVGR